MSARLIAYGIAGLALAGALWWFIHAWNEGRDALRELPVVQEQLKAERETSKLLMEETTRLATADAEGRDKYAGRLNSIDRHLADIAKQPPANTVERYYYETASGQQCAAELLGDDLVRVWNDTADLSDAAAAWFTHGGNGPVSEPLPAP